MSARDFRGEECPISEGVCNGCRRYIGPAGTCPYCGATATVGSSLRILRIVSILLATAGLATLLFTAGTQEIPRLAVKDIAPAMNFAYVRFGGIVASAPSSGRRKDRPAYMSFVIDDGTGRIRVSAYGATARAIAAQNRLPRKGDRVEVSGSLSVAAGAEPRLHLQAPEHLRVTTSAFTRNDKGLR